jgi:hypothetical protein
MNADIKNEHRSFPGSAVIDVRDRTASGEAAGSRVLIRMRDG